MVRNSFHLFSVLRFFCKEFTFVGRVAVIPCHRVGPISDHWRYPGSRTLARGTGSSLDTGRGVDDFGFFAL